MMGTEMERQPTKKDKWIYGSILILLFVLYLSTYRAQYLLAIRYDITLEWYSFILWLAPILLWWSGSIIYYFKASFMRISKRELLILLIWGILYVFPALGVMIENEGETKYSYNQWVSKVEQRVLMVDDFFSKHELDSLDRAEVVNLLGAPNDPYDYFQGDQFIYQLGLNLHAADRPKYERLIIAFDKDGRVSKYEITSN